MKARLLAAATVALVAATATAAPRQVVVEYFTNYR